MAFSRRFFLMSAGAVTASGLSFLAGCSGEAIAKSKFPVTKTDAQWKSQLTPRQYRVLRQEHTETPRSSKLNTEKRKGVFSCAGCNNRLYSSAHKYESGTGWPSFYQPIDKGAVGRKADYGLHLPRTEIHCADCGGHLGHVFDDGPKPTGLRYCMNGDAMVFTPA
jgi:peptide-methionine (R)-S-oxide reductase